MALTEEEKERRRLAANAKNRAHHARYKERKAAEETGLAEINSRFGPDLEAAYAAEDSLREERDAAVSAIDRIISELQDANKAIWADFVDRYGVLYKKRSAIVTASNDQRRLLQGDLDAQFPDLVGAARSSPTRWKPLPDREGK